MENLLSQHSWRFAVIAPHVCGGLQRLVWSCPAGLKVISSLAAMFQGFVKFRSFIVETSLCSLSVATVQHGCGATGEDGQVRMVMLMCSCVVVSSCYEVFQSAL